MSKFLKADFYYGAVLSKLLSNRAYPSLVEGGEDRRIYDFILDDREFRL